MIVVGLVLATIFVATVMTGPAGVEWREQLRDRRLERLALPAARVLYLPSASCRDDYARVEAVDFSDV